jgi:hypothetical protein
LPIARKRGNSVKLVVPFELELLANSHPASLAAMLNRCHPEHLNAFGKNGLPSPSEASAGRHSTAVIPRADRAAVNRCGRCGPRRKFGNS